MSKDFPMVRVDWICIHDPSPSWEFLDDVGDLKIHVSSSLGWKIQETDFAIMLAPNLNLETGSFQGSGFITIPRSAIQSMVELSAGKSLL